MENEETSWIDQLRIKSDESQNWVNENRQKGIDTAAQTVDNVVTGALEDWNVPGAQWIGDRSRNITGLAADLYTPEAWEIPLYIGAQVEPTPLGETVIYGAGRINKARRLLKSVKGKTLTGLKSVVESNLSGISRAVDDAFNTVHRHINGHSVYETADGVPIRIDGQDLNPNIMQSTTKGGGSIPTSKRFFNRYPDQQNEITDLVTRLTDHRNKGLAGEITDYNPRRPFSTFKGNKTITTFEPNGLKKEWGFKWKQSANRGKGQFQPYDINLREESIAKNALKRKNWNVNSSLEKANEADALELLRSMRNSDSRLLQEQYWHIMVQEPGSVYIEHIHRQNSPIWGTGRLGNMKPRDPENLFILGDQNFKSLKDRIETSLYSKKYNGKYYLDYDPVSQDLVVRFTDTGELVSDTRIPGYGDAEKWKTYLTDTLEGNPMKTLAEVDPKIPANVQRQISTDTGGVSRPNINVRELAERYSDNPSIQEQLIKDLAKGMKRKELKRKYPGFDTKQLGLFD